MLENMGFPSPKAMKTGTTIVGLTFKVRPLTLLISQNGIVLGADTRATEGPIVADKNCEKIHYIADNIFCCGAGTAADTENTTGSICLILSLFPFLFRDGHRLVDDCLECG